MRMTRGSIFGDIDDTDEPLVERLKTMVHKTLSKMMSDLNEYVPEDIEERVLDARRSYINSLKNKTFTSDKGYELLKVLEKIRKEIESRPPENINGVMRKRKLKSKVRTKRVVKNVIRQRK